jgi:hypothetical protein
MQDFMQPYQAVKNPEPWPDLPLQAWEDTYLTLHRWLQIVGKIRLAQCSMWNHWWDSVLYPTVRGLTTTPIPYGTRNFEIEFDFLSHELHIMTSEGMRSSLGLFARPVAEFYDELMSTLHRLGLDVEIWPVPVEVEDRTPFNVDRLHASYDPEYAQRVWRIILQVDRVLKDFRSRFQGKASPVHVFWGGFDIAHTRFSGRAAPEHPGSPNVAKFVMREAYSQEVSSCGFWPGAGLGMPAFYAYAYPEPAGYSQHPVHPAEAYYNAAFGEYILPYDAIRTSASPDETLLSFFQSTYEAAAEHAHWDRALFDCDGHIYDQHVRLRRSA